jgi:ABC-type Fe3+ transport system substrate-binding protein
VSAIGRRRFLQAGAAAVAFAPRFACAQSDPLHLAGSDRARALIAGARKERTVTLYSSAVLEDMTAVNAGFEKTYGVKVELWRGGSEEIAQRTTTEARGGRFAVDVIETASPQMEEITRAGLLAPFVSPVTVGIAKEAIVPGRPWIPSRLIVFTGAYNTRLVKAADLPKSYDDLLNPKWKGKLGIEADDNDWLMALAGALGEDRAVELLRGIVARNGVSVRKGHSLMGNLVVSGEVPVALTVYYHEVAPAKRAGAPIDFLDIPPVLAFPVGVAIAARSPHRYAAQLFTDYLLGPGQGILAARGNIPAADSYRRLPADLTLRYMDVPKYVAEAGKWTRLYKDILAGR